MDQRILLKPQQENKQVLRSMCVQEGNSSALQAGMQTSTVAIEILYSVFKKLKTRAGRGGTQW